MMVEHCSAYYVGACAANAKKSMFPQDASNQNLTLWLSPTERFR